MSYEAALDKVRKLLRLSQSTNQHEAALAASRAQEIIDRYKIEQFALEYEAAEKPKPDEPIKDFGIDPLDLKGGSWKLRLAANLARQNQCKVYTSGHSINLIGRPSDATTVRYIFAWLVREIERLAKEQCAGCGRIYFNNFRTGAVDVVVNRLHEQQKKTVTAVKAEAVNPHALMVVEKALANQEARLGQVQEWATKNMFLVTKRRTSYSQYNQDAREAGRRAGATIRLQPSAGALGSTRRALA